MIHEQLQLWLYAAEETSYEALELPQRRLVCWVISYVQQGRVVIDTPEGKHTAEAGEVMVHPPNQFFSEHASTPGVHQWLLLDLKEGAGLELLRRHPLPRVLRLDAPELFEHRFSALKHQWEAHASPLREVGVTSHALGLLTYLFEEARGVPQSPLPEAADRFERVIHYMRNHLAEPVQRRDLAEQAHLHATHLDRTFRALYGLTPMQMLRELRLRQARQLLETTTDSLEVVATASGFYDAAYLSRVFKKQYRETPGDYRKRVKNTKRSYLSLLEGDISLLHNNK